MASYTRNGSCSSVFRAICTSILIAILVLMAGGVALCHAAIAEVVKPIQDLPANLKKGFYDVLKFDSLSADAESVQNSAVDALSLCGVIPSQCSNSYSLTPVPADKKSTTGTQIQEIKDAFSRTLDVVLKVATDKYFGTPVMNDTATQLQGILNELNSLDGSAPEYCAATNQVYCNIYENAGQITQGANEVKTEIDNFCNTKEMKTWEDNGSNMELLHALPYVLVVAMVFFVLFWCIDAACICCGGSALGSIAAVIFTLLWLVFFIISLIVCVVGYVVRTYADEVMIEGVFAVDCSLKELLDHIQTDYSEFWDLVFKDLVAGLELFNAAFIIFLLVCCLAMLYALGVCCCRPYTTKKEAAQPKPPGCV